jgi:hypothetical protein
MTMLLSGFGLLGRFAGDLLTSALSWASSLLFGRVPRSHQIFLVLMMAGSFLWLLVGLGLLLPGIASWLFDATPHPPFIDRSWLALALVVALAALPPAVGLAGFLVPAEGERPSGLAAASEVLRGYLLVPVIAGLMIFLAGVGVTRKIRSARHGWSEVHVPIVVKPDGYDQLVTDLHDAVASADLPTQRKDAPRVLTLPAWVLTRVAGSNVRKLRPDRRVQGGRHPAARPADPHRRMGHPLPTPPPAGTRPPCRGRAGNDVPRPGHPGGRIRHAGCFHGRGSAHDSRPARDERRWGPVMIRGSLRDSGRARLIAMVSLLALIVLTVAVGTGVVFPFDAPLLAAARTLGGVPLVWQVTSQSANVPLITIAILVGAGVWHTWHTAKYT